MKIHKIHSRKNLLRFFVSVGVTFFISLLFPIALLFELPLDHAWRFIKNSPNFVIFYSLIFPLSIGIFIFTLSNDFFKKISWGWKIFLMIVLIITVNLHTPSFLDKGPPFPPYQFRFESKEKLSEVLEEDWRLREKAISRGNKINENYNLSIDNYKNYTAKNLGVNPVDIQKFSGIQDFISRASYSAFIDFILSLIAGLFCATYAWYILYIRITGKILSQSEKDSLILVYLLLLLWFPARLYAIWYENYYSFNFIGGIVIALIVTSIALLLLLVLILKPSTIFAFISTIEAIILAIIPIIGKFSPKVLLGTSRVIEEMKLSTFIFIEFVILATLMGIIWEYLKKIIQESQPKITE